VDIFLITGEIKINLCYIPYMPMDIQQFENFSLLKQAVRQFFRNRNYLEVDTPLLAPFLIPEGAIEIFATEFIRPGHAAVPLYLVPSPELWMKRIIADSGRSVFQICRCFRNGETLGRLHNMEFSMLEWYTVRADYMDSIVHTEELLTFIRRRLGVGTLTRFGDVTINWEPPFLRVSMDKIFKDSLGFGLAELDDLEDLRDRCRGKEITVGPDDTWEQLFHKLFLSFVEPELPRDKPVVLYDYPAGIPTLAKAKQGTPAAERWELYIGGIELANCFSEETDKGKVLNFFDHESERKKRAFVSPQLDRELPDYISRLPECSGVALGMDRLFMLLYNIAQIQGLSFSPFYDRMD